MRQESLRTLTALSKCGLELHHVDVTTAFLKGTLEEEVYMKQPRGYEKKGKEHLVCRLKKSIYGLKHSPRCWNTALDSHLKRMGFTQSMSDPYIYTSGVEDTLYWGVCRRYDPGWKGQDQDKQGQERTVIEVRHQGSGKAELLSGNINISHPESGGEGLATIS